MTFQAFFSALYSENYEQIDEKSYLPENTYDVKQGEIPMPGLVSEELHCDRTANSTAEEGQGEECLFRDAKQTSPCAVFIYGVGYEGDQGNQRDCCKIYKRNRHIFSFAAVNQVRLEVSVNNRERQKTAV